MCGATRSQYYVKMSFRVLDNLIPRNSRNKYSVLQKQKKRPIRQQCNFCFVDAKTVRALCARMRPQRITDVLAKDYVFEFHFKNKMWIFAILQSNEKSNVELLIENTLLEGLHFRAQVKKTTNWDRSSHTKIPTHT